MRIGPVFGGSTPTARVGGPARLRPVELDVFWESVVEHVVGLLRQRVLGDRLKCLFDVDGLLGGRLEVGNVVFAITPLLGSPGRNLKQMTVCGHMIGIVLICWSIQASLVQNFAKKLNPSD